MQSFIRVRPMPDAPSFVHLSWLDDDPPHAAAPVRRPLAGSVSGWLRRVGQRFFGHGDSPWT